MGNRLRLGVANPPLRSVDRAAKVLEILAREGEVGVSELATELEVHTSTAFRLVSALEGREMVEQNAWRGKYRLGVGILRLAGTTATHLALVRHARPVCERLAAGIDETVNIAVPINGDILYMDPTTGSPALYAALSATLQADPSDPPATGYVMTWDETEPGTTAIAAPIRDAGGHVVASLGAFGPTPRFTGDRTELVRGAVRAAAGEISRALGRG